MEPSLGGFCVADFAVAWRCFPCWTLRKNSAKFRNTAADRYSSHRWAEGVFTKVLAQRGFSAAWWGLAHEQYKRGRAKLRDDVIAYITCTACESMQAGHESTRNWVIHCKRHCLLEATITIKSYTNYTPKAIINKRLHEKHAYWRQPSQ